MLLNIFWNVWHMPIVWDFIIPLSVIAIFCVVLFWEGEYGGGPDKQKKLGGHH